MRPSYKDLISEDEFFNILKQSKVNAKRLIPSLEEVIKMETVTLEANKLIQNDMGILQCEHNIDSAELLLSWLRRSLDRT